MATRLAEPAAGPRLAIVGAATRDGLRLRERLERFGVPGSRVDLYGANQGEAVISEYAGEARLVQEPEAGEIARHDVIFLCEQGAFALALARSASPGSLVIDLVNTISSRPRPPRIHMDVNPDAAKEHDGRLAVPHPVAILLADLLAPLERELGLRDAVAVVLRPAADFGKDGIDELREQTVRLLNFSEILSPTFGKQLAFNVIPQSRLACDPPDLDASIAGDLTELLGWDRARLTMRMLTVPVFYGHSIQLRVRFEQSVPLSRVEELLPRDAVRPATPLDLSGERETSIYEVSEDGLGGFWLMAVAGETDDRGAEHAVRLADALYKL